MCLGKEISLNCVTNASFLEWNITAKNYIGLRLVSSVEATDIIPLTVNYTTFSFTRESREPLNITLSVINATVDLRIFCQSVQRGATNMLETTVRVIRTSHIIQSIIYCIAGNIGGQCRSLNLVVWSQTTFLTLFADVNLKV